MVNYNEQFLEFFTLNLNSLKKELFAYKSEDNIWKIEGSISNSAGNLTLHLIGNLNHFFGTMLGSTGYVRNREAEFADKGVARELLITYLDETIAMMALVLADADLEKTFPLKKQDADVSTAHFTIHLLGHFTYHLGQINYHRRLIDL